MKRHIMSWNIRHGGGTRVPQILEVIQNHRPDVLVLGEFKQNAAALEIAAGLKEQGLKFQAAPPAPARELSVLLASRFRFKASVPAKELPLWPYRAIRGDFDEFAVFGFYVPTGERKRPVLFFMRGLTAEFLKGATLLIGDFNTGLPRQDERDSDLTCSAEFAELFERGWIDLWRIRHPLVREYSYYERPWLGYRIDHALGSPSFDENVRRVWYSHAERESGISDHSSLHVLYQNQIR